MNKNLNTNNFSQYLNLKKDTGSNENFEPEYPKIWSQPLPKGKIFQRKLSNPCEYVKPKKEISRRSLMKIFTRSQFRWELIDFLWKILRRFREEKIQNYGLTKILFLTRFYDKNFWRSQEDLYRKRSHEDLLLFSSLIIFFTTYSWDLSIFLRSLLRKNFNEDQLHIFKKIW